MPEIFINVNCQSRGRVKLKTAASCEACNGCQHQNHSDGGWCYMFENPPETLPCGQHDKFELERQITGRLIQRCPIILYGFIIPINGKGY